MIKELGNEEQGTSESTTIAEAEITEDGDFAAVVEEQEAAEEQAKEQTSLSNSGPNTSPDTQV